MKTEYLTLTDLNEGQLLQLKQNILCNKNVSSSYDELNNANELVSDEELKKVFGETIFSEDDFSN